MTGKEFRKALKKLFKELDIDDHEIGLNSGSIMWVNNVNLHRLYEDKTLSDADRDKIWDNRVTYQIRMENGDDAKTLYAEVNQHNKNVVKISGGDTDEDPYI